MINLTENAVKKLKNLKQEDSSLSEDSFLRVFVKKGGCSGMSYKMDFSNEKKPDDHEFENDGEKVVVDQESFLFLIGMTLDYDGGLNGQGFIFENPNASKNCGCGMSFNV